MDVILPILLFSILFLLLFSLYQKVKRRKRESFISNYEFPSTILCKLLKVYPHLSEPDAKQIIRALKDYFHLIHLSHKESVAMPSQAVDIAWHEFILFTREYERFCLKAFGYFVHHTPAEAMKSPVEAQVGIKRAWELSCFREKVDHFAPKRLPKIFAIDSKFNIEDGFYYELDCMAELADSNDKSKQKNSYCAGHISVSADYAPSIDGKPVGGGRGCSGSSQHVGCSGGGGGCGGGGD